MASYNPSDSTSLLITINTHKTLVLFNYKNSPSKIDGSVWFGELVIMLSIMHGSFLLS